MYTYLLSSLLASATRTSLNPLTEKCFHPPIGKHVRNIARLLHRATVLLDPWVKCLWAESSRSSTGSRPRRQCLPNVRLHTLGRSPQLRTTFGCHRWTARSCTSIHHFQKLSRKKTFNENLALVNVLRGLPCKNLLHFLFFCSYSFPVLYCFELFVALVVLWFTLWSSKQHSRSSSTTL